MTSKKLTVAIPHTSGYLDGILKLPDDESVPPSCLAVLFHPNPLTGGSMHHKVLIRVSQAFETFSIPVLRFNFRTVGQKNMGYDEGRSELDDARFALDFMSRRALGTPIILCGLSFGAYVAFRVGAVDERVCAMLGLGMLPSLLRNEFPTQCSVPKLLVHGTYDEVSPYPRLQEWFDQISAPKRLIPVQNADHMFQGHVAEVQAIVMEYLKNEIPEWFAEDTGEQIRIV